MRCRFRLRLSVIDLLILTFYRLILTALVFRCVSRCTFRSFSGIPPTPALRLRRSCLICCLALSSFGFLTVAMSALPLPFPKSVSASLQLRLQKCIVEVRHALPAVRCAHLQRFQKGFLSRFV